MRVEIVDDDEQRQVIAQDADGKYLFVTTFEVVQPRKIPRVRVRE